VSVRSYSSSLSGPSGPVAFGKNHELDNCFEYGVIFVSLCVACGKHACEVVRASIIEWFSQLNFMLNVRREEAGLVSKARSGLY